ncbi:MAG: hypothetical protein MZV63_06790 [Marinilabiliales bacterium]|nr:hypothetical protein [Marinilabiliales bacterium]
MHPNGRCDQIAAIDRNILRIAFWEFAVYRETPVKVAINEAVELAKLYGSDSSPALHQRCAGQSGRESPARTQTISAQGINPVHGNLSASDLRTLFIIILALDRTRPQGHAKSGQDRRALA